METTSLSTEEVKSLLGVGKTRMERLIRAGIPRKGQGRYRYDRAAVLEWYRKFLLVDKELAKKSQTEARAARTLIDRALTVEDTVHFFGLQPFEAEAWRRRFAPLRPAAKPYYLIKALRQAAKALGVDLVDCGGGVYQVPRLALEKAREVLRPVLQVGDREE